MSSLASRLVPVPAGAGAFVADVADRRGAAWLVQVAAVAFIASLTAAAAQVSLTLPFTPVPFTLQPMVVLLGGALLGSRLGMSSQLLYLAVGIAGLPVFAASPFLPPGAGRLLGPTGGFLLSYPIAAFVAGYLAERGFDRRYFTSVLAMGAGLAVVFTGGTLWLAIATGMGVAAAFGAAVAPFLLADIVKLFVAAGVMPSLWALFGRRG
jgi:biotin transport system substrate-specific component